MRSLPMRVRVSMILLALAIPACNNDPMVVTPSARATSMILTPDSASIDTAGTLQVQSKLVWSDGADHPATVAFTASGGTISTTGLFTASTVAGRFLVIAACTCGLTDTTAVTVGDPSGPPTVASLTISASGLPIGIPAALSVTGPEGYHRDLTTPATLDSLKPGAYSLLAASVTIGPDLYAPAPTGQSITLAAADTKSAQLVFVKASTPASTTLPPHPRVWMTAARLMQLRAQAAASTVRWLRVKAAADKQVLKGGAYAGGDEAYLGHLCLAYLATGNQAYATRAGAILTAYAVDANDLTTQVGYNYRYLPSPTMGLDWCYAGLTVGQRHQTATWLMNRADQVWPETNPATTAYAVRDVQDNYFWGFMMTGPAALAAAGDDTLSGAVSGSNRPAYHQALALGKWNNVVLPYFAGTGAGGAWQEGIGYGTGDTQNAGKFADAFATVGQPLPTPWFADAAHWLMHVTMPGGLFKVPFGDQARASMAPEFIYDRQAMFQIRDAANDLTLGSSAQTWLNWIGQVPVNELGAPAVLVDELLRYDPIQSAAPDLSALPNGAVATGAGEMIYRQSWTDPNATAFAFRSGPQSESHASLDANGLEIWKGGYWITGNANIYSASGIQQLSDKFNTLTVGGRSQSHHDGPALVSTVLSDTLVVVRGQAASAYLLPGNPTGNKSNVSDYLRTVVYLPTQDVFVVVDHVTAVDATQAKVFRWHTKDVPQVSGNTFRLQNPAGDERCFGTVLLPTDAVLGVQSFMLGSTIGQVTSNAVTVALPTGRASDVVVTVLECTNAFSASLAPTVTTNATETEVTFGTRRVTVPLNASRPVTVETPAILRNP
jgi:hypothetical protein